MSEKKSMREVFDTRLSGVKVTDEHYRAITKGLEGEMIVKKKLSLAFVLVMVLVLLAAVALAAINPSFQVLLSQVGEQIAVALQPIELVSESNGIRMEVVAAMNDDSNAIAYITLQDMIDDRLAGFVDLYQYGISQTGMSYGSTVQYDENTRTATLSILSYGGKNLNGQKVTFALQSFLAGRQEWDNMDVGIPLDTVQEAKSTIWLEKEAWEGWGGGENLDEIISNGGINILPVGEQDIPIPGVDFACISNIGLIDGRLHVQTRWAKKGVVPANLDDHGYNWLVGKDGQAFSGDGDGFLVYFGMDAKGNLHNIGFNAQGLSFSEGTMYQEQIFTPDSDLAQYALRGYYATNKAYITGDWNVTFQLQAVKAFKQADCDINLGSARLHTMTVSPIGWTLLGEKQPGSAIQCDVLVEMADGSQQRFDVNCPADSEASFEFYSFAEGLLDVEQIKEVHVGGHAVQLVEKR